MKINFKAGMLIIAAILFTALAAYHLLGDISVSLAGIVAAFVLITQFAVKK